MKPFYQFQNKAYMSIIDSFLNKRYKETVILSRELARAVIVDHSDKKYPQLFIKEYLGKTTWRDYTPFFGKEIGQSTALTPYNFAITLNANLPEKITPDVLICYLKKKWGLHQYSILVQEYIQESQSFIDEYRSLKKKVDKNNLVTLLGKYVAWLHQQHIVHCDLNIKNVIASKHKPLIIDFDRGLSLPGKWNLIRLIIQLTEINNLAQSISIRTHPFVSRLLFISYANTMGWSKKFRKFVFFFLNKRFFEVKK